jgi:hypothetical protein
MWMISWQIRRGSHHMQWSQIPTAITLTLQRAPGFFATSIHPRLSVAFKNLARFPYDFLAFLSSWLLFSSVFFIRQPPVYLSNHLIAAMSLKNGTSEKATPSRSAFREHKLLSLPQLLVLKPTGN